MEYNSFYGGRRGASFVIVKRYQSIDAMTLDFGKGADFTDVNFDQYVIIDTANKNDPDNGKVFRRGYDFDSDRKIYHDMEGNDESRVPEGQDPSQYQTLANGAEYVGTIVGPSGKSPILNLNSVGAILKLKEQQGINAVIGGILERLKVKYTDYVNLRRSEDDEQSTIYKYNQELAHIKEELDHLNKLYPDESKRTPDVIRAIHKLEDLIAFYTEIISGLIATIPELEKSIGTTLQQLQVYIETEQDYTDQHFYKNNEWQYDSKLIQGEMFKKFKPKLNDENQYIYTRDDWDSYYNEPLGWQQGWYDVYPRDYVDIVPGKGYKEDPITGQMIPYYNDAIHYASITIEGSGKDNRSQAWIGFEFPYLVNEYTTVTVDQYNSDGTWSSQKSKIEPVVPAEEGDYERDPESGDIIYDDEGHPIPKLHPFYKKWKISVPKGIKGDSVTELTVKQAKTGDKIYGTNITIPNKADGTRPLYLYRTITDYDELDEAHGGDPHEVALVSWDSIQSMYVDSTGKVTINFTGSKITNEYYLDFINNLTIDSQNGKLKKHHTWHYDEDTQSWISDWVDDSETFDFVKNVLIDKKKNDQGQIVDDPGSIIFQHTVSNNDNIKQKYLKIISGIKNVGDTGTVNPQGETIHDYETEGNIEVSFNTGHKENFFLKYVDMIKVNESDQIVFHYTGEFAKNPDGTYKIDPVTNKKIPYWRELSGIDVGEIDHFVGFEIDSNGILYSKWQVGSGSPRKDRMGAIVYPIKMELLAYDLTDIRSSNNGKIKITYSDGTTSGDRPNDPKVMIYPFKIEYNNATGILTVRNNDNTSYDLNNSTNDKIEYLNSLTYNSDTGEITYTTNIDDSSQSFNPQIILSYINNAKYVADEGKIYFQFNNDESTDWTEMEGDTLQYLTELSYDDNTGLISQTTNKNNTEDINTNSPIIHPASMSYNPSTGVLSYTTNGSNPSTSNLTTIEYINDLEKIEDSVNYQYKVQSKTNLNTTNNIYSLDKSVNEMRITSDFHLIGKYNNLKQEHWDAQHSQYDWDNHFNFTRYNGSDTNYSNGDWVDLGSPGTRPHAYDVSIIKRQDLAIGTDGIVHNAPSPLKAGGLIFIIDGLGDADQNPWDYYDPDTANIIEESSPETAIVTESQYYDHISKEDGYANLPAGWASSGIMFIIDDPISYIITLDYQYDKKPLELLFNKNDIYNLEPITRSGYTFLGWFDAPTGGNQVTQYTVTNNKTFYAHWV